MQAKINPNYKDMIKQINGFKNSSNVKLDLMDDTSLHQFIPTKHNLNMLNIIVGGLISGQVRDRQVAKIIYGPYGTGKSHLVTIIASILGKAYDKSSYLSFLEKVNLIDNQLGESIEYFIDNSPGYITIIIDGSFDNFNECIYYSLKNTLEDKDLPYEFREPYTEAVKAIENWYESGNKDFIQSLEENISTFNTNKEELIKGLELFERPAFEIFQKVFKKTTYGIDFRPKPGNIYDNLDMVNKLIKEEGYKGLYFIFDEFGKFLEDKKSDVSVKAIQDFAEYCTHTSYETHALFVSHKQISQYIDKEDMEEWSKVEGRFQSISYEQTNEDAIFLMSNILKKEEPLWSKFKEEKKESFNKILTETYEARFYNGLREEDINRILYGSFPLHPIVGQILNLLSKKVAQNERTIFTFLAGTEDKNVNTFLAEKKTEDFNFIGIDFIYDYFEENISKYKGSPEYKEKILIDTALNKLKKNDKGYKRKVKLIKAIGVINIINDFDVIRPDNKTLISIIDEKEFLLEKDLEDLLDARILVYLRQYHYYRFFDISSIDIETLIEGTLEKSDNTDQAIEILNKQFTHFPVLPVQYNDNYKMTRYYLPLYIIEDQIDKLEPLLEKEYYDGLLVYLLTDSIEKETRKKLKGHRILYILKENSILLIKEARKLIAINYLLTQSSKLKKEDPTAILELKEYKKEIEEYIADYTKEWSLPKQDSCYISQGKHIRRIKSIASLSEYMSEELEASFNKSLIVNNELINKNVPSSQMKKAKREIIDDILKSENLGPYLGYRELSTNYTLTRSLLGLNKIIDEEGEIRIPYPNRESKRETNAHEVMTKIKNFFNDASQEEQNIGDLYHQLKSQPYGLRTGLIDVLVVAALKDYKSQAYINLKGIDQNIDSDLFERVNQYPDQYNIKIDKWEQEQEEYINELEDIYQGYISHDNKSLNKLRTYYEGIKTHYRSISKFARTTEKYVATNTIAYRNLIETDVKDYRNFFFDQLTELGKDYSETIKNIELAKHELEFADQNLLSMLIAETRRTFILDEKPLIKQLKDLIKGQWSRRLEHNMKYKTNKFIDVVKNAAEEIRDLDLMKEIARSLTDFELVYWSDRQVEALKEDLVEIYSELNVIEETQQKLEGSIQISIENEGGTKKNINFVKGDLPENGLILRNLITMNINNFGQALSYEEKRQILYELLIDYL